MSGRAYILGAGHGQTLEYILKGKYENMLLFSFNASNQGGNIWSTEIGILDINEVDFRDGRISYEDCKRFTDLEYANDNAVSNGTSVIRADAALSTDQSTILIWMRDDGGFDRFSGYDFNEFCLQLYNSSSNTVSFKNNAAMKNACKFSFMGQAARMVEVPTSFQGIELSNSSSSVYSIYTVSGNEYSKDDEKKKTNKIYRFNSNGVLKKAGEIVHSYFNPTITYEIEGVKISGNNLLFGFVRSGTGVDKRKPLIMHIPKSVLQS